MKKKEQLTIYIKKLFFVYLIFLVLMSTFRVIFFLYYNELENFTSYYFDIFGMLFLGFRIDLTVIGYIQIIPTLLLLLFYYLKSEKLFELLNKFLIYYIFISFSITTLLLLADFGFYSYFKDHLNILFFGLFEDDTFALMETFWQNYNVVLILLVLTIYLSFIFFIIKKVFQKEYKNKKFIFLLKFPFIFFLFLIVFNFFIIRGTFGMYPLGKMIPNVSANEYINKMSQNGVRAFITAYDVRNKFKKSKIDYIKETGFENNIVDAFKIHKKSSNIDEQNLLNNITYRTKKIDNEDYNVVVIMVESFGMPILKYQSEEFDIMGNLKKHFEEDILFTNIISEGDGTIASLEALLLNIPYRPNSFPFSQSDYAQTSFTFSPAFLYNAKGYNTSFIYGGDSTWRDLGKFVKYQDYKTVEGKQDIFSSIKITQKESEYFHPWGIYDEYLYDHILNKLEISNGKEMILALSTNNHPPYNIPNGYKSKILSYSEDLKNHITGDFSLAEQRLKSYGYALDSVGTFLDKFKQSRFKENTIVVITADNNTIEGIMKYDDNPIFTSKNIPIYFYLPKKLKDRLEIDTSVAGSQKDIFPTLYNLTLKDTKYLSIGNNLFDKIYPHFGFNGSMIVNHGNEVRKLNSLKEKSEDELVNYYKASLAVTEYLINNKEE
ncbi:LTA synthase family protein [Aliarcobacter cryaerophilus]|uniref:LTA synthase family protein n=1 Tax=Aliarcobacter cryaerophilus TaxID=28198 RepID=UPI0021B168DD|nr:sulfatase-like hydrolase/transferase [Aliarcobacter cryaerophilus]MCT7484327.1 sulfatase-like hydrolase/transferase [Aliarcobacter cryaerophilus]